MSLRGLKRRRCRSRRGARRSRLVILGFALVVVSIALATGRALDRTGLLEKWLGWNALRGFGNRLLESLTTVPMLVAMLAIGCTLVLVGVVRRR